MDNPTYIVWDDEGREALAMLLTRLGGTAGKKIIVTNREHLSIRLSHTLGMRVLFPQAPVGGVLAIDRSGHAPGRVAHRNTQYNHGVFMWENGLY